MRSNTLFESPSSQLLPSSPPHSSAWWDITRYFESVSVYESNLIGHDVWTGSQNRYSLASAPKQSAIKWIKINMRDYCILVDLSLSKKSNLICFWSLGTIWSVFLIHHWWLVFTIKLLFEGLVSVPIGMRKNKNLWLVFTSKLLFI